MRRIRADYGQLCRLRAMTPAAHAARARALIRWLPRLPDGRPCAETEQAAYSELDGLAYALARDVLRLEELA